MPSMPLVSCSFCSRSQHEVEKLIAGDACFICGECVQFCNEIINEGAKKKVLAGFAGATPSNQESLTPRQLHQHLDDYVIGQDQAKKTLAVAVFNHYLRLQNRLDGDSEAVEIAKSNILMIGNSGSGKTLLAQTLARFLDVPFAIADATTLTESGYVGDDVEIVLRRLLENCDMDPQKAQQGIIYIDEIDKITRKSENTSITRDVSGEGVQQALLKIIEGTEASIPINGNRKHPQMETIKIDTKDILFICGGAFEGLEKIISQSSNTESNIGFNALLKESNPDLADQVLQSVTEDHLVRFGLIPELVGRLAVHVVLQSLNEDALMRILTEPKNALTKQYSQLFKMNHCGLEFTPGALKAIALKAKNLQTGARGLRSVLESILMDTMYILPDGDIEKVIVQKETVTQKSTPQYIYRQSQPRKSVEKKPKPSTKRRTQRLA